MYLYWCTPGVTEIAAWKVPSPRFLSGIGWPQSLNVPVTATALALPDHVNVCITASSVNVFV